MEAFNLSVNLKCDLEELLRNHGVDNKGRVQKIIDSEVLRLNDKFIPLDTGALRDSGKINTVIGSGEVIYSTPYARRQYYIPMNHTGQRCAFWFEQMKRQGGTEQILAAVRKELK